MPIAVIESANPCIDRHSFQVKTGEHTVTDMNDEIYSMNSLFLQLCTFIPAMTALPLKDSGFPSCLSSDLHDRPSVDFSSVHYPIPKAEHQRGSKDQ